jgi:hypothetical protein
MQNLVVFVPSQRAAALATRDCCRDESHRIFRVKDLDPKSVNGTHHAIESFQEHLAQKSVTMMIASLTASSGARSTRVLQQVNEVPVVSFPHRRILPNFTIQGHSSKRNRLHG